MKKIEIKQTDKFTDMQKKFVTDFKSYITKDVNLIISNGNMITVIVDTIGYKLEDGAIAKEMESEDNKPKLYNMGKFENIQMMVDPYMRWDDNRIILKNNEEVVEEIEIIDDDCLFI